MIVVCNRCHLMIGRILGKLISGGHWKEQGNIELQTSRSQLELLMFAIRVEIRRGVSPEEHNLLLVLLSYSRRAVLLQKGCYSRRAQGTPGGHNLRPKSVEQQDVYTCERRTRDLTILFLIGWIGSKASPAFQ